LFESWRKILGLHCDVQKFIYFHIGDGHSISLWFNNWAPLVEFFRDKIITYSGLGRDARLSCLIAGKEWI
jgi:hypothetical protein